MAYITSVYCHMQKMLPTPLVVNCGFARVAIKELSTTAKGIHFKKVNKDCRSEQFKDLFNIPTYGIPDDYFTRGKHDSKFNRYCDRILTGFSVRWKETTGLKVYVQEFSIQNWEQLSNEDKVQHTLSECKACAIHYSTIQSYFPLKPQYECVAIDDVYETLGNTKDKAQAASTVLKVVNTHQPKFGRSLMDTITKLLPEQNVMKEPTPTERKRRKLLREIRDKTML